MKLLSERLKWAMAEKSKRDGIEIIAADLKRAAKTSDAAVSFWLNDANGIGGIKARMLADYLKVNAIWLETGEGSASLMPKASGNMKSVTSSGPAPALLSPSEITDLINLYAESDLSGRAAIMSMATNAFKTTISKRSKTSS